MAKRRPPPLNIGYNEVGALPSRRVLYRNFHDFDGKIYLVEISQNKQKVFIFMFDNFEDPT